MTCGPFEMALGDTQDFSMALVGSTGNDNLLSVAVLKYNIGLIKWVLDYSTKIGVEEEIGDLPSTFSLSQNYPNPFNPSTTIEYEVPSESHVQINIYDILGRQINTIINENQSTGSHSILWQAIDEKGERLSDGVYFYQIIAGEYKRTMKMVILK
jgi:hypothetical protein